MVDTIACAYDHRGMTESVVRALSMVGVKMPYALGTGNYSPHGEDVPWSVNGGPRGADCAGFAISWCHKLVRHRPGFNRGPWATVEDDVNVNSAIEDSEHKQELFIPADVPRPGDLIAYPTIHLHGHVFIGHVCIIVDTKRCLEWDPAFPDYSVFDVAHCHGPDGRTPAVTLTDGAIWNRHSEMWPKFEHRSKLVRVR